MSEPETPTENPSISTSASPCRGDEGELFALHANRLVNTVAGQAVAPRQTIEDACSFAWVQLLRYQPDRGQVFGWLVQVAVREAWRLAAREQRAQLSVGPVLDGQLSALGADTEIEFTERLRALEILREDERRLIWLQAAGWSLDEISQATGHSWRAVCRRLKRARRHLAQADAAKA